MIARIMLIMLLGLMYGATLKHDNPIVTSIIVILALLNMYYIGRNNDLETFASHFKGAGNDKPLD